MSGLRVAGYNIRHGAGSDRRLDLARTARAIVDLEADVIGLQEVDDTFAARSDFEEQATLLAEMLGMQARFGATMDRPPAEGRERRRRYGLALLTGHEITEHGMHLLSGHPSGSVLNEPRGVLHVRVRHPEFGALGVLVTHLDPVHRGHRAAQVLGILQLADELDGPMALVGDLNADPASPEFAPLATAGWRDAALEASGRPARARLASLLASALPVGPPMLRATFPACWPVRRLDSIWLHGEVRATGFEVGVSRASDHRPVVATIQRI